MTPLYWENSDLGPHAADLNYWLYVHIIRNVPHDLCRLRRKNPLEHFHRFKEQVSYRKKWSRLSQGHPCDSLSTSILSNAGPSSLCSMGKCFAQE